MAGKGCIISKGRLPWTLLMLFVLALAAFLIFRPREDALPEARPVPQGLPKYQLTLRLSDEEHTLAVTEEIRYRNDTGDTLDRLVIRTWLNAFKTEETSPAALEEMYDACYSAGFSPGYAAVYDVMWNGERADWAYVNADETALAVSIPACQPGEEGQLFLRCVLHIPECRHRTGYSAGEYRLGNAVPLLSVYENGQWRTEEYAPVGDPFVSLCADFSVTLYVPEGFVPVCSAELTQDQLGAWRGEICAARDVGVWVKKGCVQCFGQGGQTKITSFAETEDQARRALKYACQAMETFSGLYGPAPYDHLFVCQADFPFGGMEYPGMIWLGKGNYLESRADTLEVTAAHETAHQWFYALVGSDQFYAPWQDEALCEYAMLRYVRERYGFFSYETLKAARVDAPMQEAIPGALTPGSPVDYFASYSDYAAVVYGRGAALLVALDEMLPQGTDDFLRAYAEAFAYQMVSRGQFEEFLNRYAGMDLSPLLLDYLDTLP